MSRVFDALQKSGGQGILPVGSSADDGSRTEKNFSTESFSSVRAQLGPKSRLFFHADPDGPGSERYRLLRLRLQNLPSETQIRTLLITSPGSQEGKSTVALNLAAALAEKNVQPVLLLEGDLRCPSLERELGVRLPPGLNQSTSNHQGLPPSIYKIEPFGFYLLPAGRPARNPEQLLESEWFSKMLAKLADFFQWIVIDSPPVIPVIDALTLRRLADASIVVARAEKTQQNAIDEAIRLLGLDHVAGLILNDSQRIEPGYEQYQRYYGNKSSAKNKRKN